MMAATLRVFAILSYLSLVLSQDPITGGASCQYSVQCGIPASNVADLRELSASLTGVCNSNSQCECAGGFACSSCDVQLDQLGTTVRPLSVLTGEVDLCDVTFGGGACLDDFQCGNGYCIGGRCKCNPDWGCSYCTMHIEEDIQAGATCGQFATGQGLCIDNSDCNAPNGVCIEGKCVCEADFGCAFCSEPRESLITGDARCDCNGINCNSGTCIHGQCSCFRGFSGLYCDYEPCKDTECGEHGYCDMFTGKCVCETGFFGDDCSRGGGACASVLDCGAHIRGEFGGSCNNVTNTCDCYDGFTCQHCESKGELCRDASGGGLCESNDDCGKHSHGNGGACIKTTGATVGRCACYDGFTCSNCEKLGDKCSEGAGNGPCIDRYDCGYFGDDATGGECIDGHCSCNVGFACPLCTSTGTDCSTSSGGAPCSEDTDCGNFGDFNGGKCLAGRCVCELGYTCASCQSEGSECDQGRGGAKCRFDSDCGEDPDAPGGSCIAKDETGFGICKCSASYGCPDCTTHVAWLAAGRTCALQLESGAAYSNFTTDRSLLPQPTPTDYSKLYLGLIIVACAIVVGGFVMCILEKTRWNSMSKAIQNQQIVQGKANNRGRRRKSRKSRRRREEAASQGNSNWYFGPARPEWNAGVMPQDPTVDPEYEGVAPEPEYAGHGGEVDPATAHMMHQQMMEQQYMQQQAMLQQQQMQAQMAGGYPEQAEQFVPQAGDAAGQWDQRTAEDEDGEMYANPHAAKHELQHDPSAAHADAAEDMMASVLQDIDDEEDEQADYARTGY